MRMQGNPAVAKSRLRHFDRGPCLPIGLAGALLLVACSRDMGGNGQGGRGTGGAAGMSFGGIGGGGMGGFAGAPMLPVCPTATPTFSVCVVSDADVLPFPATATWRDSVMAAAATVEAVGVGAAPAQCANARVFGAATSSDWWVQVRTAGGVLWTIGLGGLGDAPVVHAGDAVRLDLDYWRTTTMPGLPMPSGHVQLSNTAGTPVLWAGLNFSSGVTWLSPSGVTWLSLAVGQPLCGYESGLCPVRRYDVIATVNGSVATVAPFSAVDLGGYYLAVGQFDLRGGGGGTGGGHTECAFNLPPPVAAAAVKAP
jgi:hypothetical protein